MKAPEISNVGKDYRHFKKWGDEKTRNVSWDGKIEH